MARLARIVLPNIPYHITQRGNRRRQTFFEDGDFALSRDLLAEVRAAGRRGNPKTPLGRPSNKCFMATVTVIAATGGISGAIAALGGPVTVGVIAIGVAVYAYDRYSGGKVTRLANKQLKKIGLVIGSGCE